MELAKLGRESVQGLEIQRLRRIVGIFLQSVTMNKRQAPGGSKRDKGKHGGEGERTESGWMAADTETGVRHIGKAAEVAFLRNEANSDSRRGNERKLASSPCTGFLRFLANGADVSCLAARGD